MKIDSGIGLTKWREAVSGETASCISALSGSGVSGGLGGSRPTEQAWLNKIKQTLPAGHCSSPLKLCALFVRFADMHSVTRMEGVELALKKRGYPALADMQGKHRGKGR